MHRSPSIAVRARLALGVLCRDIADSARGMIGDLSTPMRPGERIRSARRLRLSTLNVVDLAVLAELADGATWDQIAAALGVDLAEAQRRYAMTWVQWRDGISDDERDLGEVSEYRLDTDGMPDLRSTADTLDQWWRRHADPWDALNESPVARVLVDGETAPGDR